MKASVSKIDTFSTVDGPGIRTTIFFNGCKLRCKFCHNPETWQKKEENITLDELFQKILRSKPYFQKNGGVTLSGGEPLLHHKFLIELCKKLKKENIHIVLDTAGIGNGNYEELLSFVDLVILDIKGVTPFEFENITQRNCFKDAEEFISQLNKSGKNVWVRQVIVPNVNDNLAYITSLAKYIQRINHIEKIELLPFHTMAFEKYEELKIDNAYQNVEAMDRLKCGELEEELKRLIKIEYY